MLIEVRASFHGHSKDSDGVSHKREYIEAARGAKIHFFGWSEHDFMNLSVARENHRLIESSNAKHPNDPPIIPVTAAEITSKEGEVILASVGPLNERFVLGLEKICQNPASYSSVDLAKWAVEYHNGLVVFPHPFTFGIGVPSMSPSFLTKFPDLVGPEAFKNVGLEVANHSTSLIPVINNFREYAVWTLASSYDYALFGFSDFHASYQIPLQYTEALVKEVSPQGLIEAVQKRRTRAVRETISPLDIKGKWDNWWRLKNLMDEAEIRYKKFRGKD